MPQRHVVVDGSNIATEGRSLPSLAQLDQAVREFLGEFPDDIVTVVVDASFAHRIDASEVATFEEAEAAGEVVSPPAGAIGRGDAFLLRIADKTGATVLSNDSFQEFHGEHEWLFEADRLVGGKPVPGVGWIFTPRTPVRGPKSREAVKEAKRKKRADSDDGSVTGLDLAASRGRGRGKKVERAIATATEEAVEPSGARKRRRRKSGEPPADPINEPLAFITFIASHPLGSEVEGLVESFSSHGAFVDADGARCYVPLSAMGNPAPRSAREVMTRAEERTFVIQALDPLRRGVELALPGFSHLSGAPTDETIEAETHPLADDEPAERPPVQAKKVAARRRARVAPPLAEGEDRGDRPAIGASKAAAPVRRAPQPTVAPVAGDTVPADLAPPGDASPRRRAVKKAATVEVGAEAAGSKAEKSTKGGLTRPPAKQVTSAVEEVGSGKAAGPATPAKRTRMAKVAPSRTAGTKKAAAKAAGTKKAAAKMVGAGVSGAPARTPPAKKGAGAPETAAPTKTARKATAKKASADKAVAEPAAEDAVAGRTPTRKATTRKAAPRKATTRKAAPRKAAPRKAAARKAAPRKAAAKETAGTAGGETS